MNKTYLLEYKSYNSKGDIIKQGTMRVKNCSNELDAKIKLDRLFDKTLEDHRILEVSSCTPDIKIFSDNELKDFFGGIFT